jgi:hypothetical protein
VSAEFISASLQGSFFSGRFKQRFLIDTETSSVLHPQIDIRLLHNLWGRVNMKMNFYILFSVIFVVSLITPSFSQETLKIGVFDLQKVMKESKVVQGYRQKIGKELESKKKLLAEKEESVKGRTETFS